MATDNNIKNFTAADIEKYHKGMLSSKEMHNLEKAAMDDSFLAEALEGYAVPGVNASADITDLKKRLSERTEGAKVVPLDTTDRKNNFRLLKVAAMLVFVAGAAFAVYQFGFNKKTDAIAKNEAANAEETSISDTAGNAIINTPTSTTENKTIIKEGEQTLKSDKVNTVPGTAIAAEKDNSPLTANDATVSSPPALPPPASAKTSDDLKAVGKATEKKVLAKEDVQTINDGIVKQESVGGAMKNKSAERRIDDAANNRTVAASKRAEEQNYNNQQATNIFRGRVTDQNNIGVPFANVTNLDENTGTYSDAKGYFNLTYPDSILTVQVRSIGFENNNVQLRNTTPTNQVILQDDRSSLSEVVISNQKPNLQARSNNNTIQLEEPEPTDGWTYYDNYLLNNLKLPADYTSKPVATGEVLVSFEVNKNGEPVNFKIEKSLCSKCDKEAVRLIKDGPKWKRKAKNVRTTVTIPF